MRSWQYFGYGWVALLVLIAGNRARCQDGTAQEKPAPAKPIRPVSAQDLTHREAMALYGLAMTRQHADRLVDSVRLLEQARQLDPESAAIARALAPLYLALNRSDDAVNAGRKAVEGDPGDYESWVLLGRQYKRLGRLDEAARAFDRALTSPNLDDRPELRSQFAYSAGRLREELGQCDLAVNAYLQVVKILDQPYQLLESTLLTREEIAEQAADTYERMIRTCVAGKQFERAMELYAKAEKKYPKVGPRLDLSLARLSIAQKKPDQALKYLDDYLKTQPQSLEAYELRIEVLGQLDRQREVLPWLEQCAERDPVHKALQLLLAKQYARLDKPARAEPIFQKLLEQQPEPEAYRALFQLYEKHRDLGGMTRVLELFDEAVARSSEASEKKRNDPLAASQARGMLAALRDDRELTKGLVNEALVRLREGRELQPRTLDFLAALAARSKQLEEAELFYRRCLAAKGAGQMTEPVAYQGLLEVLMEAKKYDSVIEVCKQGIAQAKNTHLLIFYDFSIRGLLTLGDFKRALEQCDLAVPISASDERNHLHFRLLRMQAFSLSDKFPAAVNEAQSLLKEYVQPDQVRRIRYALSNVYSQMKDYPHSEEQLQTILKADPSDASASNDLGYLWADQNRNLDEAEHLIRRALELDREEKKRGQSVDMSAYDDNFAYLDSLGWVLFRRGKLQEARDLLEQAVKLSRGDEDPVIWDHLGDVYSRMNEVDQARTAWKKSLELYEVEKRRKLDDHYKELKRKLQLVKKEASPF
jgi:tetratricopeptide (TPR) repeat protein